MKFVRKFLEISNQKIRDNRELIKAVLYFILWPSGVYLFCVYTESLYAFFALASLYFAFSRRINLTTIFLFLAVIAHITGFFLIPLVVLLLLEEKYSIIKTVVAGLIGSLGLFSYMTYLYVKFKDPLEFLNAQMMHHWLRNRIWNHFSSMSLLDFFIIVVLIITFFYWLKRRKSFSLYTLIFIAIPFFGGQFDGFARYSLMAFPSQLMIYEYLRNKNTLQIFSYISTAILWTYSVMLFAAGFVTH
jgi:hypothetical protein